MLPARRRLSRWAQRRRSRRATWPTWPRQRGNWATRPEVDCGRACGDMPDGCKILLKARPTPVQMSDRLHEPVPDGLELYLDAADISDEGWLERLVKVTHEHRPDEGFDYVVEGPLRSLDGTFFSISNGTEANVEVVRRLVLAGRKLGAKALVIHAIAPRSAAKDFNGK